MAFRVAVFTPQRFCAVAAVAPVQGCIVAESYRSRAADLGPKGRRSCMFTTQFIAVAYGIQGGCLYPAEVLRRGCGAPVGSSLKSRVTS